MKGYEGDIWVGNDDPDTFAQIYIDDNFLNQWYANLNVMDEFFLLNSFIGDSNLNTNSTFLQKAFKTLHA